MKDIINILNQWGYEASELIGNGAFSQVYRVKERSTGCIYACKVSREQEMLKRESMTLHRISHPLFPTFHDFRQCGEIAFLFMEYVPDENLKTAVARQGPFSESRAIRISVELAKGLEYLHEMETPILFRDLKPENVMIQKNGRVKLVDLGSADVLDTTKHVITGTRGFAAPEQWKMGGTVGTYSDVYGLAKLMYFMMVSEGAEYAGHGRENICITQGKMHRGVKRLLEDCLRGDARERIPDMRCFLRRLEPYLSGSGWEIMRLELASYLHKGNDSEYIFQKNILKG